MSNVNLEKKNPYITKKSNVFVYVAHLKVEFDQAKMKLLIVMLILMFSGFTAVISQKYMNEILKAAGFELKNPSTPTLASFLSDFLGDSSLYILIIILLGMGTFSNELEVNKQVYFTLSRPISRSNYYFTRSLILTIGIALATIIGSLIVYAYSLIYFDPTSFEKIILILVIIAFQYSSIYSIMIMFSTRYSQSTAGVLGFVTFLSEALIAFIEPLKWFSPLALSGDWPKILSGTIKPLDLTADFVALFLWTIIPLLIGWLIYQKRDL